MLKDTMRHQQQPAFSTLITLVSTIAVLRALSMSESDSRVRAGAIPVEIVLDRVAESVRQFVAG